MCYVMLCYVMLCYVMLCYVMLCYVMLCYVMHSYNLKYPNTTKDEDRVPAIKKKSVNIFKQAQLSSSQ